MATGARLDRADVMHGLVQTLADLGADAEGRIRRPVPRLGSDLALVDQLRVMVADLLLAPSDAVRTSAAAAIRETSAALAAAPLPR